MAIRGLMVSMAGLLIAVSAYTLSQHMARRTIVLTWVSINVNAARQGDAHLLTGRDGVSVLIDAGAEDEARAQLLPFLRSAGVTDISSVIVTHPHFDHYGGLIPLLDSEIRIGRIYARRPTRESCLTESPWGCRWEDLERIASLAAKKKVPVLDPHGLYEIRWPGGAELKQVFAFAPEECPVGCDLNDQSWVARLSVAGKDALLAADLNHAMGAWVVRAHPEWLPAGILKAPHHGAENTVPDAFFDQVGARLAVIPAPRDLWCSDRSRRIREALSRKGTRVLVNGAQGHIKIEFHDDGRIDTTPDSLTPAEICQ